MMLLSVLLCCMCIMAKTIDGKYEPTWDSLDTRPLPGWYDESKFGIFIHWGVFSVPSFGTEWFWNRWKNGVPAFVNFMKQNYPPNWTYADFANQFTAEFYDPDQWAEIFQASGAKYIVLTSKHHEGFCNWPTNVSFNWNAKEVGPNRDLVGDLAKSIRSKTDLHFGLYHSLFEWYNPMYLEDKANNMTTQYFVERKTMPELYEIVNAYEPEVIWSDGSAGPSSYWNSTHFLAWLYNESPVKDTVVTNDRWGTDTSCKHGGFYTCHDRYNPGKLVSHKWESCMTIDRHSWGYRREAVLSDYLTMDDLTQSLAETVSCGGNLLLNVGPTHDGRIVPIFEERLRAMGDWLKVNGDAIYGSKPWTNQNDTVTPGVWYTSVKSGANDTFVYAIVLDWPAGDLKLGAPKTTSSTKVNLLGYDPEIKWSSGGSSGIAIHTPIIPANQMPCDYAWVFKMQNLA